MSYIGETWYVGTDRHKKLPIRSVVTECTFLNISFAYLFLVANNRKVNQKNKIKCWVLYSPFPILIKALLHLIPLPY